jgi:hypothetical protein
MSETHEIVSLYEADFARWTVEQAVALRAGRVTVAELEHIAEVLEDVGASEKHAVENQLMRLLTYLLKWRYQPERRGNSWRGAISSARKTLAKRASAGMLAAHARDSFAWCYDVARDEAIAETGLDPATFPARCPWNYDATIEPGFLPD